MKIYSAATQPARKGSSASTLMVLLVLFITAFVLFTYTFLHESGHALAGLLFGQRLTEFHINLFRWQAHVGMSGDLTRAQHAMQSLAGAAFPLLIWFVLITRVPRKVSFSLEVLKLLGSMVVLNTLLAWIVIPLLYTLGKAPPDDVTNFLRHSQMSPLLLMFTAAVLYARGWALFLSRIAGLQTEFLLFRTVDRAALLEGTRTTIPLLAGILSLCLLLTFLLNTMVANHALNSFSVPEGFESLAQIDLSSQAYSKETLARFTLEEPASVGVYIAVRDIDTTYFDLSVTGPAGYVSTVLHGEGYRAAWDGGLWEETLPIGTYQIILTSHQSPGKTSVYLKIH